MLPTGKSRCLGIELSDGITRSHLFAYLYAVLISSGYAGAMAVMQPGLAASNGHPVSANKAT